MATNAGAGAVRQLGSAKGAFAVQKKYTVQSHGIWDRVRRIFAVDPDRSTGVPLNAQYRNPPPGANPPEAYDDPVTVPSGDIAENPYYKRDVRRSYPRLSVVNQTDVVGLLAVGSKSRPKADVLQVGDAGAKQLIQVRQDGEEKGLSAYLEKNGRSGILQANGLPPFPNGLGGESAAGARRYTMDSESGYAGERENALMPPESLTALNGDIPRAPCPRCVEYGDISPKLLLYVDGITQGSYHSDIPATYFSIPPFSLDKREPSFEALRVRLTSVYSDSLTKNAFIQVSIYLLGQIWTENPREAGESTQNAAALGRPPSSHHPVAWPDFLLERLLAARQDRAFVEDLLKQAGVDTSLLDDSDKSHHEQQVHQARLPETDINANASGLQFKSHVATTGEALATASAMELARLTGNTRPGSKRPAAADKDIIVDINRPAIREQVAPVASMHISPQDMCGTYGDPTLSSLAKESMPPPPSPSAAIRSYPHEYLTPQAPKRGRVCQNSIKSTIPPGQSRESSSHISLLKSRTGVSQFLSDRRFGSMLNDAQDSRGREAIDVHTIINSDKQKLSEFGNSQNRAHSVSTPSWSIGVNHTHLALHMQKRRDLASRADLASLIYAAPLTATRARIGRPSPANSLSRIHDRRRLKPRSAYTEPSGGLRTPGLSRHMRSSTSNSNQSWARAASTAAGSNLTPPMSSPHFQMQKGNLNRVNNGTHTPRPGRLYLDQIEK
ncbi:uncharacterized protein KY384_006938 [Bacidia gigantensis]|uniref:uncharacterized protein n=1 Tax=Bacidia gigantensis TaxID=2732470 RepID=UPI001D037273|nr:uncharacterized protein KY384_006938 [Bacidia gigantensis]KAG8528022.1 hypothetical protein KY384_006938 [Bacidia gigantensis]